MKPIASFTINHLTLLPGIYVSRKDKVGEETITTFDIRMTRPNFEPVMNTAEMHTIEHLAATFLRNHKEYGNKTVYFGPMGCRTGFYLLVRNANDGRVLDELKKALGAVVDHKGEIFGNTRQECGNYRELCLQAAKDEAAAYLAVLNAREHSFRYPD